MKQGHSYLTFAPFGPGLELHAGEAILGDTAPWPAVNELVIQATVLLAGDVVRVVTAMGSQAMVEAPAAGQVQATSSG